MKISDYLVHMLEKEVNDIFLIPGGGCIHIVDSLAQSKINLIPTLHEQGASVAAESYAQFTNKLGVVLVTTGPGATNALTGIASAWLDSIPVLLITGQVQTKDSVGNKNIRQMGFQEINTTAIYKSITKYSVTITEPKSIRFHLEKALYLAKNGRPGPVVLDIPLDIQAAEIEPNELIGYDPSIDNAPANLANNLKTIESAAKALLNAKRPIVLVGNGVRLGDAITEFYEFINKTGIPVLTTWKALDLLEESHPQYVGRPGFIAQRGANFNQQNSDFILTIGARLDHGQLAYQPQYFAREAKKCIVDIDIHEINKLNFSIDFPVNLDAKTFLTQFTKLVTRLDISDWLNHCKKLYNKYPVVISDYMDSDKPYISNYAFIEYLSSLLPEDCLIIPGSSGACSEVTMQAFKCKKRTRVYNSEGLGAMGFGIPSAVGGCIASNKKETICIDGDGGFFMNIQELELVKRYNLPIKFFVLNNNGYGSIKTTQNTHFGGRLVASDPSSGLTLPSIELNAAAYRIPFIRLQNQKNLKQDINRVLKTNGPVICELIVDPEHKTLPRASVYKKSDGNFASRPMEDLTPFLDRSEFIENLLIQPINYE
jgi:acetolactate synthase-1/2/3 large subunit